VATFHRLRAALAHRDPTPAAKSGLAEVFYALANALRDFGLVADAQEAYDTALALAPGRIDFHCGRAELVRFTAADPRLAAIERLAANLAVLTTEEQARLHFALGKAYADIGRHERSFSHLVAGNAIKHAQVIYDEAGVLRFFERSRTTFDRQFMAARRGLGEPSSVPVFVVGMPRSGTTLVEQILASHALAFGAGELEDFRDLATELSASLGNRHLLVEKVAAASAEQLRQLGADYLGRIRAIAPGATRIVDKMPANFQLLGLIHLALPQARIIHVKRDPVDTCLSCFSKNFAGGNAYSYHLGTLGRYYRAYRQLMAHWRSVLPDGVMLDVQYEDIAADLERVARRMLAHCGLAWNAACLDFHRTDRPVRTASAIQVRQPIYRTSVGRWRPNPDLLAPLIEGLGENPGK